MNELPSHIQELICSLAEVCTDDDFVISVCLACLGDEGKTERIIHAIERTDLNERQIAELTNQ